MFFSYASRVAQVIEIFNNILCIWKLIRREICMNVATRYISTPSVSSFLSDTRVGQIFKNLTMFIENTTNM
jgi:hypothetical protein